VFKRRLEEFDAKENRRQVRHIDNELKKIKERVRFIKDTRAEDLDEVGYSRRMLKVKKDETELKQKKSQLEQDYNRYYEDRESERDLSFSISYGEREQIEKIVEKVVVYKVEEYDFDWEKIPKKTYFVDTDENGKAEVIEIDTGPNIKRFNSNDKMLYIELYLFDHNQPIKGVMTGTSLNRYVGQELVYDEPSKSLWITETA
jgi:hypothetical protein